MSSSNHILEAIQRLASGQTTSEDIQSLQRELYAQRLTIAGGERSVAVLGDVTGAIINTGDNVRIEVSAQALRMLLTPKQLPKGAPHFSGRKVLIQRVIDELQPGHILTLVGPGGIGKSTLAAAAILQMDKSHSLNERFPDGVLYHNFYNGPKVAHAMEHFARTFGEDLGPTVHSAALRALAGRRSLLVLDGAEVADDLEGLLQVCGSCSVLITSRRRQDIFEDWIEVPVLPKGESVPLLMDWAAGTRIEQDVAIEICDLIGHLPLAVTIAGSYLKNTGMPSPVYCNWLSTSPLNALHQEERQSKSVDVLLEKSLSKITEVAGQVAGHALGVAGLLALSPFSSDAIHASLELDEVSARRALGELVNYSLLHFDGGYYQVSHRLIHEYAQTRIDLPDGIMQRLVQHYESRVHAFADSGIKGYSAFDPERPHILFLLQSEGGPGSEEAVQGLQNYVRKYFNYLSYTSSKWLREIMNSRELIASRVELLPDHVRDILRTMARDHQKIRSVWLLNRYGYEIHFTPDFSEIFALMTPLVKDMKIDDSFLRDWYAVKALFESNEKIILLSPYVLEFRNFLQRMMSGRFQEGLTPAGRRDADFFRSRLGDTEAVSILDELDASVKSGGQHRGQGFLKDTEEYKEELGAFFDLLNHEVLTLLKTTVSGGRIVPLTEVVPQADFKNTGDYFDEFVGKLVSLRPAPAYRSATQLDAAALSILFTMNTMAIEAPHRYPFLMFVSRSKYMLKAASKDLAFDVPGMGLLDTFWKPETYLAFHLVREVCENDFDKMKAILDDVVSLVEDWKEETEGASI